MDLRKTLGLVCLASAALLGCGQPPMRPGGPMTLAGGAPARSPGAKRNPSYELSDLKVLTPGKYHVTVKGVQCNACTRAIVEELKQVKGVESASFDFEEGVLWLTVKKDAAVKPRKVSRALAHAARRVDFDADFEVEQIRYAEKD